MSHNEMEEAADLFIHIVDVIQVKLIIEKNRIDFEMWPSHSNTNTRSQLWRGGV